MKKFEAKNGKIDYPKLTNITDLIESDPYYPFKVRPRPPADKPADPDWIISLYFTTPGIS